MSRVQEARKSRPAAPDDSTGGTTVAIGRKKPGNYINADATIWARLRPIKNHALRGLLIVIAGCADKHTLQCWPSQSFLALHSGQSERTVRTQLALLVELGFIRIEYRRDGAGQRLSSLITVLIDRVEDYGTGAHQPAKSGHQPANFPAINRQPCLPVIKEEQEEHSRTVPSGAQETRPEQANDRQSEPMDRLAVRGEVDAPTSQTPPTEVVAAKFEEFWNNYPIRQGWSSRDEAWQAFRDVVNGGVDPNLLVEAARRFAVAEKVNVGTKFIPMAATWLRKRRWMEKADEIAAFLASDPKEQRRLRALEANKGHFR